MTFGDDMVEGRLQLLFNLELVPVNIGTFDPIPQSFACCTRALFPATNKLGSTLEITL